MRARLPPVALLIPLALAPAAAAQPLVVGRAPPTRVTVALQANPWGLNAPAACTARVLGGHNYFFCPYNNGFDGARDYCHAFGAELASMGSRYENDAVAEVVRGLGRGRHMIGHHDRVTEGQFEAVDGSPATFSAWAAGEPNNVNDEDCVELDGGSYWNDIPCAPGATPNVVCEESSPCTVEVYGDHLYHLCRAADVAAGPREFCRRLGARVALVESEGEARFLAEHGRGLGMTAEASPPDAVICETASPCARRFFEGRMYEFCLRENTTADGARRACAQMGGALAVVDDARINDFFYASLAIFRRSHFYIDLRDDDTEGSFYSHAGPARFTAWLPGEPNNVNNEDCVELADGGWNDVPCAGDTKNAFVCEMPVGPLAQRAR